MKPYNYLWWGSCGKAAAISHLNINWISFKCWWFMVNRCAGWWFGTFLIVHTIWDVILPIDFHIFQRGRLNHQPVLNSQTPPGPSSRTGRSAPGWIFLAWRQVDWPRTSRSHKIRPSSHGALAGNGVCVHIIYIYYIYYIKYIIYIYLHLQNICIYIYMYIIIIYIYIYYMQKDIYMIYVYMDAIIVH